jgi:serine/threonine protein kinase
MVIDFGIAQVADSVSITRTGMAVGSPGYMAPEQVTGHAGREADIFTWALIVSFAASGQPPFGTGETIAILHRILNERPDISAVPPQMLPLVQVALEKDPSRRPGAADILQELQSPGSTQVLAAPAAFDGQTRLDQQRTRLDGAMAGGNGFDDPRTRTLAGGAPGPGYPTEPSPAYYGGPRPQRRWRGPAAAAAVLAVAVVIGAVLLSSNGSSGGHNPSGATTPTAKATGPAQSSSVTRTSGTPDAGNQGAPGQVKKHKHGTGTGTGTGTGSGTGTGNGGGGSKSTTAPSATPSVLPSQTASVAPTGPATTPPPTPTSTSTSGPGTGTG